MAQKGEATRQRIIDATAALMQSQGFHATGLNQIIQESGAPKGSLYFHFPEGKETIAIAAMEQSGRQLSEMLGLLLAASPRLLDALDPLWRFFMDALAGSDFRKGCPIATLTLEAAGDFPGIQICSERIYRQWQDQFSRKLQEDGHSPEQADMQAGVLLALLEGALVLARARRSLVPLQQALVAARTLLAANTLLTPDQ